MKALLLSMTLLTSLSAPAVAAEATYICEADTPNAAFEATLNFHRAGDVAKAAVCAQKACDANLADGCFYIGFLLQQKKQHEKANVYYRKACDLNYAVGCLSLGNNYRLGIGIEESPAKSFECYKRACELGDAMGCSRMQPHPAHTRP